VTEHSYDDIFRRGFDDYHRFVNPLISQRAQLAGEPLKMVKTKDGRLITADGLELEDFHGTQAFGHRNDVVTKALQDYLASDAPSWYPARVNPFSGTLARELSARTGDYYDNVFFACSGSDAIEAALKLARALTRRPRILALEGGYHGCSFGSVSLMTPGYLRDPFGPHLPGVEHIPFGDVDALHAAFAAGDVAALVMEPIQGEGGVRVVPEAFIEAACALTEKHGALLVADEVQTAMGRTGRGFLATSNWPRRPDVVCLAKHLGGGLVPLSAMMTTREIFLAAYGKHFASGESHNTTMGFNALTAVGGLAALELLTDAAIERVQTVGARFKAKLAAAIGDSPLVEEVRGEGFMMGVKLHDPRHPWLSFEHFGMPELKDQSVMSPLLCRRLYRHGFFCFTCGHDWSIFRLQPRFDIPESRLDDFVEACREALAAIEELV